MISVVYPNKGFNIKYQEKFLDRESILNKRLKQAFSYIFPATAQKQYNNELKNIWIIRLLTVVMLFQVTKYSDLLPSTKELKFTNTTVRMPLV